MQLSEVNLEEILQNVSEFDPLGLEACFVILIIQQWINLFESNNAYHVQCTCCICDSH